MRRSGRSCFSTGSPRLPYESGSPCVGTDSPHMVARGEIVMINVAVLVIVLCIGLAVVARLDFRER